ncbi:unnamed protein product [Thelazia callipaeda]|uniref:Uncharacterized protein n=1 Tax=Thelazia callipaeda TaxID=103827 RepID=A0A0N5CVS7_THECL|nr:unnamed protein product [Thelazia callipaeda]
MKKNLCSLAELGIWCQEWDTFLLNLTFYLEKSAIALPISLHDKKLFNGWVSQLWKALVLNYGEEWSGL